MSAAVTVHVPGSTSNLGAGFDCVGVAIDRRLRITARLTDGGGPVIERGGTLSVLDLAPQDDLLFVGFAAACRAGGREAPAGVLLGATSDVPIGRGLGSSAAATLAGAAAANELLRLGLDHARLMTVCAEVEGHPDNVAAAVYGGATLALRAPAGAWTVAPLEVDASLALSFAVPDFAIDTRRARAALPETVPHREAAAAAARAAALVQGLAHADGTLLALALDDRLHVPYRRPLVPGYDEVTAAAVQAGAWGATLSGSGSAVVAVTPGRHAVAVADAMGRAWRRAGASPQTFVVSRPGRAGGHVVEDLPCL